jgi:hypothetical protein
MLFTVNDLNQGEGIQSEFVSHEAKCLKYISEIINDDLNASLGEIQESFSYDFDVNHKWSLHDIIVYCVKQIGPCELHFATYAIKEYQANLFGKMKADGALTAVHALLDYRVPVHDPSVEQLMKGFCNSIGYTRTHAKLSCLINEHTGIRIVGSANLTTNTRLDVGVITRNRELTQKRIDWIQSHINKQNGI